MLGVFKSHWETNWGAIEVKWRHDGNLDEQGAGRFYQAGIELTNAPVLKHLFLILKHICLFLFPTYSQSWPSYQLLPQINKMIANRMRRFGDLKYLMSIFPLIPEVLFVYCTQIRYLKQTKILNDKTIILFASS